MNTALSQNCRICHDAMADLLLDPDSVAAAAAQEHLRACAACSDEFAALAATMHTMDAWQAPEPTPWFDGRLKARLREVEAARPEGLFERLRSYLLFSSGVQLRPVLVAAFAVLLAVMGGTAFEVSHVLHPAVTAESATVQDLQILDRNEQAIQTMDQLLSDDTSTDDNAVTTAPSS